MGASSSSAFWTDNSYDHSKKQMSVIYEEVKPHLRVVRDIQFTIEDAKKLLDKTNLYPDITLILDVDFTLGQCSNIEFNGTELFLDSKKIDIYEIQRLIDERKATWYHDKSALFFMRPYFKEFVQFCDKNFKEVIIWTNGIQRHADNTVELVESMIGKKWRGFGRDYSTYDRKIVTNIGLDPEKTWLVDDDARHYYVSEDRDITREVNPDIKFFHGPEFSMAWFKDLHEKIPLWGKSLEIYDDWFLFLIWNWNYMKENGINMEKFIRHENRVIY